MTVRILDYAYLNQITRRGGTAHASFYNAIVQGAISWVQAFIAAGIKLNQFPDGLLVNLSWAYLKNNPLEYKTKRGELTSAQYIILKVNTCRKNVS